MFLHTLFSRITDFGDSGLLAAVTAFFVASLWLSGGKRQACALGVAFFTAAFVIACAKLVTAVCHAPFAAWHVYSPSGHTALSTATYGMLAQIAMRPIEGKSRWIIALAAVIMIAAIGLTRIALGAHSPQEVVIGWGVGLGAFLTGRALLPASYPAPLRVRFMLLPAYAALLLFYGNHSYAEAVIQRIAARLPLHARLCAPAPPVESRSQ